MHTGNPRIDNTTADLIVGSDEAGRGNWAGPLVTAAVCVPRGWQPPPGVTDSKQVKQEARRYALRDALLRDKTLSWVIVQSHPESIDRIGVQKANIRDHLAVHESILIPGGAGRTLLRIADGNLPLGADIVSLPKADVLVAAVSAASIFAKTALDQYMRDMDKAYPGYDFGNCKGYGTPAHEAGLKRLGPCIIHRRSFAPIRAYLTPASTATPTDLFDEMPE